MANLKKVRTGEIRAGSAGSGGVKISTKKTGNTNTIYTHEERCSLKP